MSNECPTKLHPDVPLNLNDAWMKQADGSYLINADGVIALLNYWEGTDEDTPQSIAARNAFRREHSRLVHTQPFLSADARKELAVEHAMPGLLKRPAQ